jgi:hypothetical protein
MKKPSKTAPKKSAAKKTTKKKAPPRSPATSGRRPPALQSKKGTPPAPTAATRVTISKPGLYPGMPAPDYNDDPCPEPSIRASLLATIAESSPAHARLEHPRLNPRYEPRTPSKEMEFGSAAHAMLLGAQEIHLVDAINWRSEEARRIRDVVRSSGKVPILKTHYPTLFNMTKKLRAEIAKSDIGDVFGEDSGGVNEVVAAWKDSGVWCRLRADRWIPPGKIKRWPNGLILDYKTTFGLATVGQWSRQLFDLQSHFQAVFYPHGMAMAINQSGGSMLKIPDFRFIVQEANDPHEFSILALSEIAVEHTTSKIARVFDQWAKAIAAKTFDGYPRYTAFVEPPPWELKGEELAATAAIVLNKPL